MRYATPLAGVGLNRVVRRIRLINLVVRSDVLQQNGLGTFVLDEFKDEPQVVTGATRPGTVQFAFQFVCFQRSLKCILHERCERCFEGRAGLPDVSSSADAPPSRTPPIAKEHASFRDLAHQFARGRRQTTAFCKLIARFLDLCHETPARRLNQSTVQDTDQLLLLVM